MLYYIYITIAWQLYVNTYNNNNNKMQRTKKVITMRATGEKNSQRQQKAGQT